MTIAPEIVVPYITAREGAEADSFFNLRMGRRPDGRPRLRYVDEAPPDRDLKDVLWARYSTSLDTFGQPCGTPRWRMVHSHRQRVTIALLPVPGVHRPLEANQRHLLPYRHPQIGMFLASHLVRELRDHKVVNLDDLVPAA
ncbi:hypothetical protein ACFVXC_08015 [Streptomyces sp. NPDC058257]|uniref:hypothetical protein n=1 Tax=Streptomyces sp. NPDC058257 TaxID=3346409 RepID=UPI0036EA439B